jgi:hypothetical protein
MFGTYILCCYVLRLLDVFIIIIRHALLIIIIGGRLLHPEDYNKICLPLTSTKPAKQLFLR